MKTKEELLEELRKIEEKEKEDNRRNAKERNYEQFKNRIEDAIIGRAHISLDKGKKLEGSTIGIHGNCGDSYSANADVTDDTHLYFHNMWSFEDRRKFQERLNQVAMEEIKRIMDKLNIKLDLIGLQSTKYFLDKYPEEKHDEILAEREKAIAEVLSQYTDEDFLSLIKHEMGWVDENDEPVPAFYEPKLSHSKDVLYKYIREYRPRLIDEFKKCRSWDRVMGTD